MRRRLVLVLSVGFVANAVPCAGAGDLGYPAAALWESAAQRLSFDGAPRLDSRPAPSKESKATEELKPSLDKHIARCFAKIDERVLINGPCQVLATEMSVTFELSGKAAEAVHESAQQTAEPVIKRSPERGGKNAVPLHSQKPTAQPVVKRSPERDGKNTVRRSTPPRPLAPPGAVTGL